MTRMTQRIARVLLALLGVTYAIAGVLLISTGNVGGMSLGLLFLGGAVVLHFFFSIQQQVAQMRELLTLMVIRSHAESTTRSLEMKDEAQGASRPRTDVAVSHGD